jgi:hypothetical protein
MLLMLLPRIEADVWIDSLRQLAILKTNEAGKRYIRGYIPWWEGIALLYV